MKVQYVAEDGKVFSSNEDDPDGTWAKMNCEEYEQFTLGIDHGWLRINPFSLVNPLDE